MFTHLFAFDWVGYQPYLPYFVGCAVAVCVFSFYVGRRVGSQKARRHGLKDHHESNGTDPADEKSFGDRRTTTRREGQPVSVHLSSPAFQGQTRRGWVLDRSTGGLRISLDAPVAPGTAMQMLAEHAPDTTPWVTTIVRSCKPMGKKFELGCEFEETPPWNVLLLFG